MICTGRLKWKRKLGNLVFYSYIFNFSAFDVRGANSCWVEKVSWLPETKLEAETGAPVHHILMEKTLLRGQDVMLNMLEVFVNRWRHMPANVTSFGLEKGGRNM